MILALLVSSLLTSPLWTPDCQRLCLGECHYDYNRGRCYDSRVVYIGTWDPVPLDYSPPTIYEFPVSRIPFPVDFGYYPLEQGKLYTPARP
jgi:hypothetical protein